jgi:hypothetical protein
MIDPGFSGDGAGEDIVIRDKSVLANPLTHPQMKP